MHQPVRQRGRRSVCIHDGFTCLTAYFGVRKKLEVWPDGADLHSTMARTRSSRQWERPTPAFLKALGIVTACGFIGVGVAGHAHDKAVVWQSHDTNQRACLLACYPDGHWSMHERAF